MTTKEKNKYYLAKGKADNYVYIYYGPQPPIIDADDKTYGQGITNVIGSISRCPISDNFEDNTVVEIQIRKIKSKQ